MPLVIIEDSGYFCTEEEYQELSSVRERFEEMEWYLGIDVDEADIVYAMVHKFKPLGPVVYDFRL
ncbi:hypothetical protein D3C72_700840 [compost metagenome]